MSFIYNSTENYSCNPNLMPIVENFVPNIKYKMPSPTPNIYNA